ncbi:unnamed protein product [Lupinus luteus]|uniref:Protein ABIL1 n=1 Tax=Lupinus luteus TaxID=3873 RepID=A0AAV1WPQ9_LUPLU
METSNTFILPLHELNNLRPQLYSAAEYCQNSYLHTHQKQMVLDNLKDYAVRALVNVVDHLGTVAYKLTNLLEHQTLDVSTMDLKISTLNQKLHTCLIYTDKEGLRQQQLLAMIPRHHKHYILPNSANKKVHFNPKIQTDARQDQLQTRKHNQSSGIPVAKTLSWHLASETKSTLKKRAPRSSTKIKDQKICAKTCGVFQLIDKRESMMKPFSAQTQLSNGLTTFIQTLGVKDMDAVEGSKALTSRRRDIGSKSHPLKAALLINHDPNGPSRLLSTIAEQEGIKANPIELNHFVDFIKRNKLHTDTFIIGSNQYLVTSIHDNWFSARCINTSKPAGEGAIVTQTAAYILVAL